MHAHYSTRAFMYTVCPYFRVRVLANKKVQIVLNLLYLLLEKNLGQFYFIARAAITSLFLRFVLFLKVFALENIFVLISKKCPYFDLCPYFCFILGLEVLIPGTSID